MKSNGFKDPSERSILAIRSEALWRLLYLHSFARFNGSLLVTEYPKSGGTWLSRMLSDALDIDFPRHRAPSINSSIFHGHYCSKFRGVPTVVLWRDPRDIMVSWYHHLLVSPKVNPNLRFKAAQIMPFSDFSDVGENLPSFIRICFSENGLAPGFTWNQFFDYHSDRTASKSKENEKCVISTSYEKLRNDPCKELSRLVENLGYEISQENIRSAVKMNTFEAITGRKPGEVDNNSYLRKGIIGDWKNQFSSEAEKVLDECTEGRLSLYINSAI